MTACTHNEPTPVTLRRHPSQPAEIVRDVIAEVGRADNVLVNSRPDIAELTGARGVHLPETGLDPRGVRRSFPGLLIGVSRHDRAGLDRAREEGADFALLGPAFQTPGKEDRVLGMIRLEEILKGVDLPAINYDNLFTSHLNSNQNYQ